MRYQLKAMFDDLGKAQEALDRLLGSGYTGADAVLVKVPGVTQTKSTGAAVKWRAGSSTSPVRFLSQLFEHEHSNAARAAVVPQSPDAYLLTLSTASEFDADRARSLIASFVHNDREDVGASTSAERTNAAPNADPGHAAPGPLWYDTRASGEYSTSRKANDRSTSAVGEPNLPTGQSPSTPHDLSSVKQVHTDVARTEVEASVAFRFACHLHENERFRNRSWNEASGDLRTLWEARDPAGPGWESSKDALHRGWDSTRPEIDDDSYRRSHWNISYGNHAAQPQAKQAPSLTSASAAAKTAWKGRHPGALTPWENFMDAVKHGWERIRLEGDMDEAVYRLHHAQTYPNTHYDDVAPVYRYGNNIHRRRAFRDRSWDAAEPELRAEWERGFREGKPLTWDETKAAFHHGWDQTRT